jgi:hypothetical protein
MKSIISILIMSFEQEFSKIPNLIGWLLTTFTIINSSELEKVNLVFTVLLTLASLFWVVLKIILAIKNSKNDSSK